MFLTSIENTERAVAQPSPLCHNETLAPACCGFSERPLCPPGHQPWSQPSTYAETVEQPASYPEVAQEEGKDSAAISNKQFMLFLLVTIFAVGLETYMGNVNWLLSARTSPKLISPHLSPSREGRHP